MSSGHTILVDQRVPLTALLADLRSGPTGLTGAEAAGRL
jgi:hypothetical protein